MKKIKNWMKKIDALTNLSNNLSYSCIPEKLNP